MAKIIDKTTIKFILVGVINTLVGTTVMFLSYNLLHLSYWISSAANYVIGSIVSYFLNKYFTFRNNEKSFKQVLVFALNIALCYFLAYGMAKPIIAYILRPFSKTVQENAAMLAGMCLFVGFNYLGQRFVVFKNKK